MVRGDDSYLGNFWAFRYIVRPTMLEAWWQENVAACLMPSSKRRHNTACEQVRDFIV